MNANSARHVLLPVSLVSTKKKDNFVALPLSVANNLSQDQLANSGVRCLRIGWYSPQAVDAATSEPKGMQSFVGWSGKISKDFVIEVPVDLAETLGIKLAVDFIAETSPQKQLFVSVSLSYAPVAKRVDIEPLTPDDWEVLKLDAGFVEENLLSQICVLSPKQVFPVFIHNQTRIKLQVTEIFSGGQGENAAVRLARDTEVVVAPKLRRQLQTGNDATEDKDGTVEAPKLKSMQLRVQDILPTNNDSNLVQSQEDLNCVAFVHPATLDRMIRKAEWPVVAVENRVVLIDSKETFVVRAWSASLYHKQKRSTTPEDEVPSQLISLGVSDFAQPGHVMLPHSVRYTGAINLLTRVILAPVVPCKIDPSSCLISFRPAKLVNPETASRSAKGASEAGLSDSSVIALIRDWIQTIDTKLVLSDKTLLRIKEQLYLVNLAAAEYVLVDSLTDCSSWQAKGETAELFFGAYSTAVEDMPTDSTDAMYDAPRVEQLTALRPAAEQALARLKPTLDNRLAQLRALAGAPIPGGIYLCGDRGCGKSHVVRAVASNLSLSPSSLVYNVWVECAALKGCKRSQVRSTFESALSEALAHAPSLLIFDDLDILIPQTSQGQEDAQTVWLAEWLADLLSQFRDSFSQLETFAFQSIQKDEKHRRWNSQAVACIATGKGKRTLRASLLQSGMFDEMIEIESGNAHERSQILETLVDSYSQHGILAQVDLEEVGAKAEGYSPADLKTLTERALHGMLSRNDGLVLTQQDFVTALEGFTPASLRGIKLAKSDTKWSDVGGLKEVRETLKETLELPLSFAPLYERCPVKLASGILLYGPPGCGKTLLAGAVASECGLNFISVKGPEVLDKYIGASEKAVRDLFGRAGRAAPCILFFDEFEAIAPRRGNDSTGVTDRVVNQLLTFLDGVESRAGVYVMAASSRPDLIDPALLRPGRLDKQLLCDFPSAEERVDILHTVASKMELTAEATHKLKDVATSENAELFTGADLQAILYTAQLEGIHKRAVDVEANTAIDVESLNKAVKQARPSVSAEERLRYNSIYQSFKGERTANFAAVDGYPDGKIGERTSLK